jgi:hypothetical protein
MRPHIRMRDNAVKAEFISVPKEPASCPVCDYRTKINGRLQHDPKCNMRSKERHDDSDVTDAMRHAAWVAYPSADVPYTEIYRAMIATRDATPQSERTATCQHERQGWTATMRHGSCLDCGKELGEPRYTDKKHEDFVTEFIADLCGDYEREAMNLRGIPYMNWCRAKAKDLLAKSPQSANVEVCCAPESSGTWDPSGRLCTTCGAFAKHGDNIQCRYVSPEEARREEG